MGSPGANVTLHVLHRPLYLAGKAARIAALGVCLGRSGLMDGARWAGGGTTTTTHNGWVAAAGRVDGHHSMSAPTGIGWRHSLHVPANLACILIGFPTVAPNPALVDGQVRT